VNIAVVSGSPKMVLLLNWAIDKNEELELIKKKLSQTGGDSQGNRRIRTKFTRRKECEVEGEDLQRLFEVYVNQESIPSTSTGLCLPDAAEEILESVSVTESNLAVPDVKDHTIDKIYETDSEESINIPEVYNLVEEIVFNEDWGNDQETVDKCIDICQKDVDFGFVPVPHVFLHFLFSSSSWKRDFPLRLEIVKRILVACKERDEEEGGSGSRVVALFNMLDPRGRTFLHAAALERGMSDGALRKTMDDTLRGMPASRLRECWNARDGAGRTFLHLACIHDVGSFILFKARDMVDVNVDKLSPLRPKELDALKTWCFPQYRGNQGWLFESIPMSLAVLFNSTSMLSKLLPFKSDFPYKELSKGAMGNCRPLQVAAFLGRTEFLEHILKVTPIFVILNTF
jgi:hypothetical protein